MKQKVAMGAKGKKADIMLKVPIFRPDDAYSKVHLAAASYRTALSRLEHDSVRDEANGGKSA